MGKMQFDPVDAGLTVAMMVSGFIMTGIASFSLFNINFADVVWSSGSMEITVAYAISALALLGIVATNDNAELSKLHEDAQKLDDYYYYAVLGTVGLMVGWVLLPDVVASFFTSSDLWALAYVGITTTGSFAVGWML